MSVGRLALYEKKGRTMDNVKINGKVYGDVEPYDVWVEDISHPSGKGGYDGTVDFHRPAKGKDEVIFRVRPLDGKRARYVHEKHCSILVI